MRIPKAFLAMHALVALVVTISTVVSAADTADPLAWPAITREHKPWGYWWWLGSAVDRENITKELTRYRDAGMGGVHIIPIYGARGWEGKYIPYLSDKWMEMLKHVVSEADRLGLGVDMTTGTGWCFGGPNVPKEQGTMRTTAKVIDVKAGASPGKVDRKTLVAVVAKVGAKEVDLTAKVGEDGTVEWKAPEACKVLVLTATAGRQGVKRSAPGGEGPMLNPFYRNAIENYLVRFQQAFDKYDGPRPRAMYHDSYEYQNDWSPDLFAAFQKRRGYKLQDHLYEMFAGTGEATARVKCDYRETISDVMLENFTQVWVDWCHKNKFITRDQAHGSPGNLLDLYAAADVPETEMFHTDREIMVSKFASSAAHVAGRKLVAAETGTWLAEHFTETLGDVKGLFDDLFVSGVNHVIYHGTCYSPDECPWPGFLFYASTEMNPRNSIWRDVPALNAYAARCQVVLQSGSPANDILLYWPIHDLWHNEKGTAMGLTVHGRDWILKQPLGEVARKLWQRGFQFDFVSDRQLAAARGDGLRISVPGGSYQVVVVPRTRHMPGATLKKLLDLAGEGRTIIFDTELPADVPGLADLEQRRAELKSLIAKVQLGESKAAGLKEAKVGVGLVLVGDVETALARARVYREPVMDTPGVKLIRRGGMPAHYFIANHGTDAIDGWAPLALTASLKSDDLYAGLMDPATGKVGLADRRKGENGMLEVYLQIPPGGSMIVEVGYGSPKAARWGYRKAIGEPVAIVGPWEVKFISGGPALPGAFKIDKLESWTNQADPEARRFAGTGVYSTTFDAPGGAAGRYWLDLGKVCQSARVRVNGQEVATLFTPPFATEVQLKEKGNVLEVEVTNVSANRIRDLDIRGVQWKIFHDINIVNIDYKPFNASKWSIYDSGLIGPVKVQAVGVRQ